MADDDNRDLGDISKIIELAERTERRVVVTQDSVGLVFAERYDGQLLFDHDTGRWFRWTGTHWQQERTRLAFDWARNLTRELTEEQSLKVQGLSRKTSFCNGVESFCQADRRFAVTENDWNNDHFLLATPSGTIELRTGKTRPANPADRINKITGTSPADTMTCPRWLAFLDEATDKDDELIGFLQRWFGYCLTGDISEHALIFCYGPGGNGKGVMLNTASRILGDYARTAAMQTFIATKFEQHPTDVALLCGARLVTASETESGQVWAESKLKQLTGGDPVSARFMRQDFSTYARARIA